MNNFLKKKSTAFTLIELLVVIAIIGILSTLAVVAIQSARSKARDSKRIADVKQMQTALELYFNDNGSYPTSITSTIATAGVVYMTSVPTAPTPADGSCSTTTNAYTYSSNGSTYTINFCLGGQVSGLSSGEKVLNRDGILSVIPWACGDMLVDSRDSQQYPTVQIGAQCWMAKNINYDDGCSSNTWVNSTDVRWCGCYENSSANCTSRGRMYQWSAAMAGSTTEGAQGICPSGWHVPSSAEFATLSAYLGGDSVAGGKLKQIDTTTWASPNTGATNETGFTALAAGRRNYDSGSFFNLTSTAGFWSSLFSSPNATYRSLGSSAASFFGGSIPSSYAHYVRCLKN